MLLQYHIFFLGAFCGSVIDRQLFGLRSTGSPSHMNYAWCLLAGIQPCLCCHCTQRQRRRLSNGDHREQQRIRQIHRKDIGQQGNTEDNSKHRDVQHDSQKENRYFRDQFTQILKDIRNAALPGLQLVTVYIISH